MIEPLRDDLMVQQQLPGPGQYLLMWQHMVAVIMLNQTGRKPVKTVFPTFVDRWRAPVPFLFAKEEDVKSVIWPLGLVNVRYQRLKKMTQDYIDWNGNDARDLYGIGKYGSDSYEIFFKNNYSVNPTDKELIRYLKEEVSLDI